MAVQRAAQPAIDRIDKIFAWSELRSAGFVMRAPHCHDYFELFYVETGACSFFTGNNMYDVHAGDYLLIPPQVFHYTRYSFGACKRWNVFFHGGDIDGGVAELMPHGNRFFDEVRIFRVPEAYRTQTEQILAQMMREARISDDRSPLIQHTLLNQLLLLCGRVCDFLEELPENIHTTDRQIVVAAQYISEHYMDDISAADIARAAGYSPNYLSKKFREAAGLGVHEYLTFIRLQHAALELVSTGDSVTEIAMRCGFSNGNYFKDAFKKKYGVTPREYRK